jgi:hypothetical protein
MKGHKNPKELYHYTSPKALKGILKSNNLWFSNIYFLNDKSEMKYTYYLIIDILSEIKEFLDEEFYKKILARAKYITCNSYYEEESEIFARLEYYVFCMSTKKNCLSLWNNYTKTTDRTGYSITFSYNGLKESIASKDYEFSAFAKVCYDEKEQKEMLTKTIYSYNEKYLKAQNGKDKQIILWDIIDNFKLYSVFLKHSAFVEENEFRIVLGIRSHSYNEKCEFEIQNGIFVPHIEHGMPEPEKNSIIKEIMISPTCDKELAVYSVRKLANATQRYFIPITVSEIPLRTNVN